MAVTDKTEIKIMRKLARRIIDDGFNISVGDGEEITLWNSTNVNSIMEHCGATEESIFYVNAPGTGHRQGFFWFIHGNGEDNPSDHTDNELCNRWAEGL